MPIVHVGLRRPRDLRINVVPVLLDVLWDRLHILRGVVRLFHEQPDDAWLARDHRFCHALWAFCSGPALRLIN